VIFMGEPKKQKKKYEIPRFPWRKQVLESETNLLGQYGLRNKKELYIHRTMVSKFRGRARTLLSMPISERSKLESPLLERLKRIGILSNDAVLDNVLDLAITDILERRLQTIIFRKGLASSIHQARQLINHRHIAVGTKKIFAPGYLVQKIEEDNISFASTSPLIDKKHPLRMASEDQKNEGENVNE
jgi:small subunit ribosomal protein S4